MAKDNKSDITPEEVEALEESNKRNLKNLLEGHINGRTIVHQIQWQASTIVGLYTGTKLFPNVDKASLIKMGIQRDRWIKYIADQLLEKQLPTKRNSTEKI
jgi:hypothetical protein